MINRRPISRQGGQFTTSGYLDAYLVDASLSYSKMTLNSQAHKAVMTIRHRFNDWKRLVKVPWSAGLNSTRRNAGYYAAFSCSEISKTIPDLILLTAESSFSRRAKARVCHLACLRAQGIHECYD